MTEKKKIILRSALLIFAAVIMFAFVSKWAANPDTYSKAMETLDAKKTVALEMTTASTAASVAVTCIPGDVATPIAEKLADLSGYLMIILTALFLEKYLLTLTGILAFKWIIPIAFLVCAFLPLVRIEETRAVLYKLVLKVLVFAIAVWAVVPATAQISNVIDQTYQSTAQQAIDDANEYAEGLQANSDSESSIEKYLNKITAGTNGFVVKLDVILNNFIEAIAVMIVTTCVLPIGVIALYLWMIKLLTGVEIKIPVRKRKMLE